MFKSEYYPVGQTSFPEFSKTRIMMMPVILGDLASIPRSLNHYGSTIKDLFEYQDHDGDIGYLTIDEQHLKPGTSTRRPGLHVDGVYRGNGGSWGGSPAPWAGLCTGMLLTSTPAGCRAWNQTFEGDPGPEGECEHLKHELQSKGEVFEPNKVYWANHLCVHESMLQEKEISRQFVRLSLPSIAPWFEGYTENPLGVLPTGPILPRRKFMDT